MSQLNTKTNLENICAWGGGGGNWKHTLSLHSLAPTSLCPHHNLWHFIIYKCVKPEMYNLSFRSKMCMYTTRGIWSLSFIYICMHPQCMHPQPDSEICKLWHHDRWAIFWNLVGIFFFLYRFRNVETWKAHLFPVE